jgi:acetyl esterase/lipase
MRILPRTIVGMVFVSLLWTLSVQAQTQGRVEKNVVYGMVSGAALLMDVYYPDEPNQRGIFFVQGSGWNWPMGYSAGQIKDSPDIADSVPALLERGFTVFVANYRLAPAFRYPASIEDLRWAVRYIRANASRFGVAPEPLGGYGISAGSNLVGLLALQDGVGELSSDNPVERQSAKIQAVVLRCSGQGLDLTAGSGPRETGPGVLASYLGEPMRMSGRNQPISEKWIEASPLTYLSDDDPPVLMTNAMDDMVASFASAEAGAQALRTGGLDVEFIPRETGGHCRGDVPHERIAEWLEEKLID